jgi:type I restriction enzyme S subunit
MIRFKIDLLKVLPYYLFEFTQSSVYKMWVKAIQRTTGQPNINAEEYQSLQIPVPPFDKQKEIAKHITDIRQQAQQLKDNTKEALKKASAEIEKKLIG